MRYQKYYNKHSDYTTDNVVIYVEIGLDNEFYTDPVEITNYNSVDALVNKYHKLPAKFEADDLVTLSKEYSSNSHKLKSVAATALMKMIDAAKEEGINFLTLHNPIEYIADENGAVAKAVLQVMELGEPDASGRRSPVAVEGKTVVMDVDQVIVAVGVSPNPLVPNSIEGLELGRKNTIAVNDEMRSSRGDVFAGGDIVRGGATVILAMGDGRRAALNMHKSLQQN